MVSPFFFKKAEEKEPLPFSNGGEARYFFGGEAAFYREKGRALNSQPVSVNMVNR